MNSPSLIKNTQDTEIENKTPVTSPKTSPQTQRELGKKMPRRVRASNKSATAFRTISEVAEALSVQQHVLRFWETKFSQIRPLKRGGGRRYYRPEDMALLKRIHHLLYTEGYTIKGVQKLLQEKGKKAFVEEGTEKRQIQPSNTELVGKSPQDSIAPRGLSRSHRSTLKDMLSELKELKKIVEGTAEA